MTSLSLASDLIDAFWFETAFFGSKQHFSCITLTYSILLVILFLKLKDSTACTLLLRVYVVVVLLNRKNTTKTNFGVENASLSLRVQFQRGCMKIH